MTDEQQCSEQCRARRPLGSESHLSSCPLFGAELHFLPTGRQPGESLVVRGEDDRPVYVPDEIIAEAERDFRAYKAFRDGQDWREIAERENYPDATAAAASVKRHLDTARAAIQSLTRQDIVTDHVSRLMFARRGLVDAVREGKPASVMAFLAVEDRWVKAFGLDQPDAEDQGVSTVVVPSEQYLAMLRSAAQASQDQANAG